ncbi:maf protein [Psychromonas sp. CNPT3]|uniref:Maf family protein n=1 Tax=Psychromonas sp. CNPT3 TaxID=314282 RepID=UPI00006E76C4|nr:Maf family protein [Psychromonas sp. CNPT3]AGH80617.1 maf protein [Psychromonas sp. CNPT3]
MIYLASRSPRRAELLQQINVSFCCVKADIEECQNSGELAEDYVLRLATQKAQAGFMNSDKQQIVLGADTIVVIDGEVLEKPQNQQHALQMMQRLSAKTHHVFTAVALYDGKKGSSVVVKTAVTFKILTTQEITDYWQSGEPQDKAGGYAIQGFASKFVTHISGSYSAVVGLPLYETDQLIKEFLIGAHHVG